MKWVIPILLLVACNQCGSARQRQCELAGGVVMRHRDVPVCVAREGLRFLPINPEYGP